MRVLFVCKANIGRSQMAESIFNRLSKKHSSFSAGTDVDSNEGKPLHELVIGCMTELGYDLSNNKRKQLTAEMVQAADQIVVMIEKKDLPLYLKDLPKVSFWSVDNPKDRSFEFHCMTRDQIKKQLETLIKEIG